MSAKYSRTCNEKNIKDQRENARHSHDCLVVGVQEDARASCGLVGGSAPTKGASLLVYGRGDRAARLVNNNNNNKYITSIALKSSGVQARKRNKTKALIKFKNRGHIGVIISMRGRRQFKEEKQF